MIQIDQTAAYGAFAADVFTDAQMERRLPPEMYRALHRTMEEGSELTFELAGAVAAAMMEWAVERGATHFTHWFQPMTGATAEKRDTFLDFGGLDRAPILSFSAKALIRGEADGSSFPSGGLRATFEARGYTTWDCTSPAFLKRNGDGTCCLCIPTAFCSFSGEALDEKTPLLRSMEALSRQAVRVLRLLGDEKTRRVAPSVGGEQEYFLIDKRAFVRRKDLVYAGRTLFGAPPAKGQELSDQYYAATPEPVVAFMHELNAALWRMGVPCKTEHNEVAPAQYELAPLFVSANLAADHNQIIMETMRRIADRHDMTCLLHEKPFAGVNGSGKHNNWSLLTDGGVNLLKPGRDAAANRVFFTFLMAVIAAVDEYAPMLRMSCATIGNESRLGGAEAPPPILSVFLGNRLQAALKSVAAGGEVPAHAGEMMHIGVSTLAEIKRDDTDRNRTSPFAFTGNKFEFRMVGASQSLGLPNTVLNTIVAESLMRMADALEAAPERDAAWRALMADWYAAHERVLFNGNNYDAAWAVRAARRGLPVIDNTVDAINVYADKRTLDVFARHGVLSEGEALARREVALGNYATQGRIEAVTMVQIARQSVLPACARYSATLAEAAAASQRAGVPAPAQTAMLRALNRRMHACAVALDALEAALARADGGDALARAAAHRDLVRPRMERLRACVDALERIVDKEHWPMPSYGEMLFRIV